MSRCHVQRNVHRKPFLKNCSRESCPVDTIAAASVGATTSVDSISTLNILLFPQNFVRICSSKGTVRTGAVTKLLLPLEFVIENCVAGAKKRLIEFDVISSVGAIDLSVQPRCPRLSHRMESPQVQKQ